MDGRREGGQFLQMVLLRKQVINSIYNLLYTYDQFCNLYQNRASYIILNYFQALTHKLIYQTLFIIYKIQIGVIQRTEHFRILTHFSSVQNRIIIYIIKVGGSGNNTTQCYYCNLLTAQKGISGGKIYIIKLKY